MRVLMFGWEFPPHISGGLGTACYGLTAGLLQQNVKVLFVVPRLFGDEEKGRFKFVDASDVVLDNRNLYYTELIKKLDYIQVSSSIMPYMSPDDFAQNARVGFSFLKSVEDVSGIHFDFTGLYGKDLMKEVAQYALVAARIAGENDFDVIHAHDWLTYPAGIMAKQISGKPLVIHVHATEYDRSGDHINKEVFEIEKMGMDAADAIIAVSAYTKTILMKMYGIKDEKIQVVHNGVMHAEYPEAPAVSHHKHKIVTFLGRITFQKGPEYFVEAAKKVLEKFPDTRFVMAGNGDMLIRMIKRVAALRIGSRFHFTGFLQGLETQKMYGMSDVYVMPSVSEPFGISPLEAASMGIPVIISHQSGVSEVLHNTLKVDFWDIDALADAICGLLKYPALSTAFSRDGKIEVAKLKWEMAAQKVKTIYQSVTV